MVNRQFRDDDVFDFDFGLTDFASPDFSNETADNDLFSDLREEERSGTFFNVLGQANLTPNQRAFFESDQTNILNQFSGILDKALAEGRLADETFAGFIEQPGFFGEQFRERGGQTRAAPITRVIN